MLKKPLFTLIFITATVTVSFGQSNALERGFEGRSQMDSAISRKYITPLRMIALPEELTTGVANTQTLLKMFDGQLTTTTTDMCMLTTTEGKKASILLDYGKEIYGGIEIAAAMRPSLLPIKIRVRYGESVSETMSDIGGQTPMTSATNEHTIRDFTLDVPWLGTVEIGNSGFRFVRIDVIDKDAILPIKSVRAVLRYRDIPYLGSFKSDNERLNQIWETGAYTVHLNMQDYLWDGIKRDRLVWLGDMHPEVMAIQSVFGGNGVVNKSLDMGRDFAPLPEWMNTISAYSMWWVLIQRDLYMYQGNYAYLAEQHDYMKALMRQLIDDIDGNKENIQNGFRLLDWPTSRSPEVIHAGYQALLVMTMEAGTQLADWLGDKQMGIECAQALKALKKYVPSHENNKQAAAMLSLAGVIDPVKASKDIIAKDGAAGFSTFYGYYMLCALAKGGEYEQAMQIISDYWGAMLDLGATTFWENLEYSEIGKAARIDELVPEGKFDIHAESGDFCYTGLRHSLCHGWGAGPTPWLTQYVLGVTPLEPGCKTVKIEPHLGALKWVEGTFPTPFGVIKIRHETSANGTITSCIDAPKEIKIIKL